jgi:hypothetical protein
MTTTRAGSAPNLELVEQIRQLFEQYQQDGRPTPGRPTIIRVTGARDYQVKKALEILKPDDRARDRWVGHHDGDPAIQLVAAGDIVASNCGRDGADAAGVTSAGDAGELGDASPGEPGVASAGASAMATSGQGLIHQLATTPPPAHRRVAASTRLVAWGGFLLGLTASMIANVLDAWLPALHQLPGWTPGLAPQIGGAFWPAALMFAVEALSRVPWPEGQWWAVARYGGVGTVALGSAAISYGHVHDVLISWGYGVPSAVVGPLVIDGLMLICGFALLAISRTNASNLASPGDADDATH